MRYLIFITTWIVSTLPLPAQESPAESLQQLFDEMWAFELAEFPLLATATGVYDYSDQLPKVDEADHRRRAAYWQGLLDRLTAVDRATLSPSEQVSYDLFAFELQDRVTQTEFQDYLLPVNAEGGFHTGFAFALGRMPLQNTQDYRHYLARLEKSGGYFDAHFALMREGLARGITQPKVLMEKLPVTIRPFLVDRPEDSEFFRPFQTMPASIPAGEQEKLREAGRQAIAGTVLPAFQRFLAFMENEYIPGCRTTLGASELPRGKEWYEQRIRFFTTLDLSPEEVFTRGQQEVARIRADMESVIRELGFEGNFDGFLAFLRTDPQFYAETPEELLHYAAWLSKSIDGKLPQYFNRLPRLPYGVAPVPDAIAPNYTGGRYVPGSLENQRAGTYWVNTYQLESRPLYVLPALTLHEAVPGHHLQHALNLEQENVPAFRQKLYLSAYGEGWALYCEYLGREMGIYETPYQEFGRLTYEMWRACRLVIDVGLHYKGWTRQQAVAFLAGNSALSLHEVNTEIDRYIGWPGQAVSYKTGELKIRELRKRAERELGEAFDLREFHDLVLSNGTVLLSTLKGMVDEWIEQQKP